MTKIGRNDPCPCGSGEKYKKCCLGLQAEPRGTEGPAGAALSEIRQELEGRSFNSLVEVNAFISERMGQRNCQPREDFAGLSAEQVGRFLYYPFDSPELVTFPEVLAEEPVAPMLNLFRLLVEAIGEEGLKPTAKGNLPRAFCREAAQIHLGEEGYREKTRYVNINKEEDFFDLHVTRLVAELAGLVRKYRGKFILGGECRKILTKHGLAGIYPRLLRAYIEKFNWGYRDRYAELGFIQQSVLFTLYLLHNHGKTWLPHLFYEDAFLRAFPMVLEHVPPDDFFGPERTVRSCYTLRALEHFAGFLGLAKVELTGKEGYLRQYRVRKSSLLDAAVCFHL